MLFLLGTLGLFQICFIPGAIVHYFLFKKTKITEYLPMSFALSLVLNWCLVLVLTALKIYSRTALAAIVFIELIILFYIFNRLQLPTLKDGLNKINNFKNGITSGEFILHLLCLITTIFSITDIAYYIGSIFTGWDAVISWNRWAVDWANNSFPLQTAHYPQLLPANWSLSYVLQGNTEIQFFSFASALFFIPLAVISIYSLWLKTKEYLFVVFGTLVYVSFKMYHVIYGSYGYADVPVACMAIFSIVALFNAAYFKDNGRLSLNYLLLGGIFAAGSAATKQPGLYFVVVYLLVIWHWSKNGLLQKGLVSKKKLLSFFLINVAIWIAWYIFTEYRIRIGVMASETSWVLEGIHRNRSYIQRVIFAFENWPQIFVISILGLIAIKDVRCRVFSIAGFIFVILWGALFSYDLRNSIMGFPLIMISLGSVLSSKKVASLLITIRADILKLSIIFISTIVIACLSLFFTGARLQRIQETQARRIGNATVNEMIYDAFANYGVGTILSNYQYIGHLPQTKGLLKAYLFEVTSDILSYKQFADIEKPKYYLIPFYANQQILTYIKEQEGNNALKKIGVAAGYTLYFSNLYNTPQ